MFWIVFTILDQFDALFVFQDERRQIYINTRTSQNKMTSQLASQTPPKKNANLILKKWTAMWGQGAEKSKFCPCFRGLLLTTCNSWGLLIFVSTQISRGKVAPPRCFCRWSTCSTLTAGETDRGGSPPKHD